MSLTMSSLVLSSSADILTLDDWSDYNFPSVGADKVFELILEETVSLCSGLYYAGSVNGLYVCSRCGECLDAKVYSPFGTRSYHLEKQDLLDYLGMSKTLSQNAQSVHEGDVVDPV